jgi:hypothetical protein
MRPVRHIDSAVAAAIASPACFRALNTLPGTAWYHVTSGSHFQRPVRHQQLARRGPELADRQCAVSARTVRPVPDRRTSAGRPDAGLRRPRTELRRLCEGQFRLPDFARTRWTAISACDWSIRTRPYRGNSLLVTTPLHRPSTFTYLRHDRRPTTTTLDWLPSLNARLALADDFFLRIAASRTVTRPTFLQLDPGLSLSASTATLLGSGTSRQSPICSRKARPTRDLSLEYYFGGRMR